MPGWRRQWPVLPTFTYGGMNYGTIEQPASGNGAAQRRSRLAQTGWTSRPPIRSMSGRLPRAITLGGEARNTGRWTDGSQRVGFVIALYGERPWHACDGEREPLVQSRADAPGRAPVAVHRRRTTSGELIVRFKPGTLRRARR